MLISQTIEECIESGRKNKEFWYTGDNGKTRLVTGYEVTDKPKEWWCPEIGYTCCEGESLFKTKKEALLQIIKKLGHERETIEEYLSIAAEELSECLSK